MKKIKIFKSGFYEKLKLLLIPIGLLIGSLTTQMWGYYVYVCTEYCTNYNNDYGHPHIHVPGLGDREMTSLSQNWWVCDVGDNSGTATVKRYYWNNGIDTWQAEFQVTVSSTNNIIYASTNSSGYVGSPRHYDGNTYIYWKVAGNNIPSWWYSGTHKIQFRKNDNTVTGWLTGENIGENFIRYLVPEGEYVNAEVQRADANYSGPFAFNATSTYNLIYDFKEGGYYANWSIAQFAKDAYIYMDNTASEWSTESGYNKILIGRANTEIYSTTYPMKSISDTKLLCYDGAFSFNNFNQMCFIHTTTDDWGAASGADDYPGKRKTYAANHTNEVAYLMDGGSKTYNLFTPDGAGSGDSYPTPAHTSASTYAAIFHSDQRVNTVAKTTGSYSSANSKAEITLSSYKLNSATTSTTSSGTVATTESTNYITACKTATTTLTCSNTIADGYQFDGWYAEANGGDALNATKTFTYPTTGATTIYARFSAKSYSITLNDNGGGSGDGTHSVTYDAAVGSLTNTPVKTNYAFCGYETSTHVKIFNADKTPVSSVAGYTDGSGNWIKDGGETLYAIWEDQYGIYGTGEIFASDWGTWVGFPNTGTNTYGKSITLTKGEDYVFKVVDRNTGASGTWWGNMSGTSTNLVIDRAASGTAQQLYSATAVTENITITPDVTGPYTFSYNTSNNKLTITYPTSYTITFGIGDLNGSNSAITATASPSFSSGDYVLRSTAVTFNKGTTKAGYHFDGWYPNSNGTGDPWSTTDGSYTSAADTRSANIEVYACYSYQTYSITYKDQGNVAFTGTHGDGYPTTHTYNTATDLVSPTKTGYAFGGWYKDADCTISAGSSLGATDYTDDITLYAKWIPVPLTFNGSVEDHETEWGQTDNWTPACVPTSAHDVIIASGATLAVPADKTIHDLTVKSGATLNITDGSGSGVTLTVNSLSLEGGWTEIDDEDVYDMPRVYIDPASTLYKAVSTVNLDVAIDNDNYYPIAVPFPVDVEDVDYADVYLAGLSTYGFAGQYAIKKYNGQQRADRGSNYANWEIMNDGDAVGYGSGTETLEPGHGYIITALPTTYDRYATMRFPMTVDNAWTAGGEKGSATISAVTITKNAVSVFDYKKAEGETPKNNKGWNLLGVPFMSCYASSSFNEEPDEAYIKGKLDFSTGTYTDEAHVYVSVPTYDFSEYIQSSIDEAVLLPGWCFFVQFDEEGTLTFNTDGERVSAPFRATKYDQSMPTVKTGIILSGAEASDKTTILVSDKYSASEYEINADLEKLFGENSYTLATYSLSGETRLAYNAMSNADATQMIPIGYRAPEAGEYTFSINPRYADGAFGSVNLIDYETNTVTDLLQSSYTFSTERTQNDARFALNVVPAPAVITAIENEADGTNNGARKILLDGKMYIILNGQMYDATGALVK